MGKTTAEDVASTAAWKELKKEYESANRVIQGTLATRLIYEGDLSEGSHIEVKPRMLCNDRGRGAYEVDYLFPKRLEGHATVWGIDEGVAAMLMGMVRALKPKVLLETGTNRGRSTRAILDGMGEDAILYTVDMIDHDITKSGAILPAQVDRVRVVTGATPEVFHSSPLSAIEGIEFAFLDGTHTKEGVIAELEYLESHRADECTILVDNARDAGWPELWDYFDTEYNKYHHVNLDTMTGTEVITMRN